MDFFCSSQAESDPPKDFGFLPEYLSTFPFLVVDPGAKSWKRCQLHNHRPHCGKTPNLRCYDPLAIDTETFKCFGNLAQCLPQLATLLSSIAFKDKVRQFFAVKPL